MPSFISVMLRILDENGITYNDDIIKTITPLGYSGTAKYFKELGLDLPLETIIAQMNNYAIDLYTHTIPAKEHVVNALRGLKARGASINVLTASPHSMLDPCLKRLGIFDLFSNVWSCDDFHTTKANPEIYFAASKRLNIPQNQILFLDDNYNAVSAAKASGMKVCGVYDQSSAEYEEEIRQISDFYIRDFSELENLEF